MKILLMRFLYSSVESSIVKKQQPPLHRKTTTNNFMVLVKLKILLVLTMLILWRWWILDFFILLMSPRVEMRKYEITFHNFHYFPIWNDELAEEWGEDDVFHEWDTSWKSRKLRNFTVIISSSSSHHTATEA